mmetsp:Transcript_13762/g.36886  ORF Transcript_13762/g.36886 Transcript_13762/m.36886 type:complete len:378 (-) Transcript_13762:322-1455(-)
MRSAGAARRRDERMCASCVSARSGGRTHGGRSARGVLRKSTMAVGSSPKCALHRSTPTPHMSAAHDGGATGAPPAAAASSASSCVASAPPSAALPRAASCASGGSAAQPQSPAVVGRSGPPRRAKPRARSTTWPEWSRAMSRAVTPAAARPRRWRVLSAAARSTKPPRQLEASCASTVSPGGRGQLAASETESSRCAKCTQSVPSPSRHTARTAGRNWVPGAPSAWRTERRTRRVCRSDSRDTGRRQGWRMHRLSSRRASMPRQPSSPPARARTGGDGGGRKLKARRDQGRRRAMWSGPAASGTLAGSSASAERTAMGESASAGWRRCSLSSSHSVTASRSLASRASRASMGSAARQARSAASWDRASASSMRWRWE